MERPPGSGLSPAQRKTAPAGGERNLDLGARSGGSGFRPIMGHSEGIACVRALLCLVVALGPTVAAQTPDTAGRGTPQRDLMDLGRQVLGREPDTVLVVD